MNISQWSEWHHKSEKRMELLLDCYDLEDLLQQLGYSPIEIMSDLLAQGYFTLEDLESIYCELE